MMTQKEFKREYGKYSLDVLTLIYMSGASSPIPMFRYSTITAPEIKEYLKLPKTIYIQFYINKLEDKSFIRRDTKGNYRKIYINENLPNEVKSLMENRKRELLNELIQPQPSLNLSLA